MAKDRPPELFNTILIDGEPCRQLPTTKGLYAIVDADVYDKLMQWYWCAQWQESTKTFRVSRSLSPTEYSRSGHKGERIFLSRQILGLTHADAVIVDHRNHDTLDNRRSNLRKCDRLRNNLNRRPQSKSGYKGVTAVGKKWYASIMLDHKTRRLGIHTTPEDAAHAYDKAAREMFGEFAYLNFPQEVIREEG
jgi:hypothetical protein